MKLKAMTVASIAVAVLIGNACATKKYVRNRVNERATPLESRTGELEETSRRSTQDIGRLGRDVEDVRQRTDRAQSQADRAASSAEQANTRVTGVEQSVSDLRSNLDKYTVQKTVTVQFQAGKSELSPEATASLDELASQIKDRNGFLLEIEGFASSEGKADLNAVNNTSHPCKGGPPWPPLGPNPRSAKRGGHGGPPLHAPNYGVWN